MLDIRTQLKSSKILTHFHFIPTYQLSLSVCEDVVVLKPAATVTPNVLPGVQGHGKCIYWRFIISLKSIIAADTF